MKLIFAQGNPEPKYKGTRHNVGFRIINQFAKENDAKWENKPKFHAIISEITINNEKIILAKPTTFYNETGLSVRSIIDFYKLDPEVDLLVIYDDLSLPFGTIRIRKQGSDAGNNGIKSINAHINQNYTRIKVGTCNEFREKMDDATFVLSKFSDNELKQLKESIDYKVIESIDRFCNNTLETTSHKPS
ncbi:MAG: peptidyl-tRNA hydrolase, family [Patescibacteria group bacterium]|nr:peptidyl-tRNA hydrolase, family [Patescibacteria group bacterium]